MADSVIIDLDWEPPVPAAGRRTTRRPVRRLLTIAVAVLCVAVLGGVEPAPPRIFAVLAVPIDERPVMALTAETIVVGDAADTTGGRVPPGVVSAYALPSGALRWRAVLPDGVRDLTALPGAGVVLALGVGATASGTTTVLDIRDGRRLWSSGSVTVLDAAPDGTGGLLVEQESGGTSTVRWADLRTGRAVWSRSWPTSGDVQFSVTAWPPGPTRLVLPAADGTVDLIEERTGTVLASGRLGGTATARAGRDGSDPPEDGSQAQSVVAGDRVVVLRPPALGRPAELAAFDTATLAPQWTRDVYPGYLLPSCRPMLCMGGEELAVVDPATGRLWRGAHWQFAERLDDGHLVTFGANGDSAVVDARTGRAEVNLSEWRPVYDNGSGQLKLLLSAVVRPHGGFWVARLRATGVLLVGYVPSAVFGECLTAADLLACQTQRGIVQVWRYRG